MNYEVSLEQFEGPLDLLLHLIKTNKMDIYDISISKITEEYLDFINKMEEMNLTVASSYLVMASELLEIKSKYATPRKSEIRDEITEIKIDATSMIPKEDVMVVVTNEGYIKRTSLRSYAASPQRWSRKHSLPE